MDRRARAGWRRVVLSAGLVFLAFLAMSLGPPWLLAAFPRPMRYAAVVRLLQAARSAHGVLLFALPVAASALAIAWWRGRRRGAQRPGLARALALCVATMFALAVAEGVAGVWLARGRVAAPRLPTWFPDDPAGMADGDAGRTGIAKPAADRLADLPGDETLDVVILGESSACGFPYHQWFSVARIVAWKLEEAIPGRRCRVEHLARPGIRLDMVHDMLGRLEHRPDLVILYAGHNEFDARYQWERAPRYYVDDPPPRQAKPGSSARERTPLDRLIQQAIDRYRISIPPPRNASRPLVDVPVYTAAEYAERLRDFRGRLEAMTADFESLGALMVLLPPPANDADFEPNRSFLSPRTTRAERDRFARDFLAARRAEEAEPARAMAAYRALLGRQPGFAEAHYRLARLLEANGEREDADRHYVAARDCDGFPVRCPSDFLDAYREVAADHPHAILVDAPAVLRGLSARGTAGDEFFADGHHPSIVGYAALSRAILRELQGRRAFGWPAASPPPAVAPAECAAHFGMDAERWSSVAHSICCFYSLCGPLRYEGSQRLARANRYLDAMQPLADGRDPETFHLPGIGVGGGVAGPRAGDDGSRRFP